MILESQKATALQRSPVKHYKSILQEWMQQKGMMIPQYITTQTSDLKFKCTVAIDDESYLSSKTHYRKKDAEEDAAQVACEELSISAVELSKRGIATF